MEAQPEAYQPVHHAKRALRGWRVILDKIGMLLQLVALQGAMQEWCLPQPAVLECSKSSEKAETLEDYYYEVIKEARALAPFKAKDGPMVAASSCVHPKQRLKGGGNASSSYVVCRDCHTRWEAPIRAAEARKYIKDQKRGPLSQGAGVEAPPAMKGPMRMRRTPEESDETFMSTDSMEKSQVEALIADLTMKFEEKTRDVARQMRASQAASSHQEVVQVANMQEESRKMILELKERGVKQEAMMQMLMTSLSDQNSLSTISKPRTRSMSPSVEASNVGLNRAPMCKCQKPAEKLVVKKEGPRKGREFWKCVQRECNYFAWVPKQRSKSPKRSEGDTAGQSWRKVTDGEVSVMSSEEARALREL